MQYVIEEPRFTDSPQRCFKLPFVATEAFISDCEVMRERLFGPESKVLHKLFSFFTNEEGIKK